MTTTERYESLLEVIKERRVNGNIKSDPIPFEDVERAIEAGRWAPSGNNAQPWDFVVLRTPERVKGLTDILSAPPTRGQQPHPITYAPVAIVVVGDTRLKESYSQSVDRDEVFHASLAASIMNFQLAVTALGLASSWGTISHAMVGPVKEYLGLPEPYEIVALIRMGHPAELRDPKLRRPLEDIMHVDGFDQSRARSGEDAIKQYIEQYGKGWGRV